MKKNIFSVIITALTVINVVLTAILFFVMLPTFQKTNTVITQVASVLNIELDADKKANADENYTFKDLENLAVAFDAQETYNLKSGADGKAHYAMLKGYTLSLNKTSEDYSDLKDTIDTNKAEITDIIRSAIQNHTIDDADQAAIQKESLEKIQKLLDSKVIVKVMLDGYVTQ